jgi:hypothetical protein
MIRSKYGMLEIFRSTFYRSDAIMLMRRLNKKFNAMSKDDYLKCFEQRCDAMILDIRSEEHLPTF